MNKRIYLFLTFVTLIVFVGCKKETGSLHSAELTEYMPMQVGKFITYRVDSLLFVDFGRKDTIVSSQAKDVVAELFKDNLGRDAYRIVRYQRDLASTNEADWAPIMTYTVIPSRETVELVENNLRFQKLKLPIREGFSWHGNTFLPGNPYEYFSNFSNDEDMPYWDYTYQDVDFPLSINNFDFDSTITIHQIADSSNVPITEPYGLAYKNYWIEQYAKHIGLVFREQIMWEYQPPNGGIPGFKTGFGITMTIIDHN